MQDKVDLLLLKYHALGAEAKCGQVEHGHWIRSPRHAWQPPSSAGRSGRHRYLGQAEPLQPGGRGGGESNPCQTPLACFPGTQRLSGRCAWRWGHLAIHTLRRGSAVPGHGCWDDEPLGIHMAGAKSGAVGRRRRPQENRADDGRQAQTENGYTCSRLHLGGEYARTCIQTTRRWRLIIFSG